MEVKELEAKVDKLRAGIMNLVRDFKTDTGYSVSEIDDLVIHSNGHPPEVVHVHRSVSYDGQSTFRK